MPDWSLSLYMSRDVCGCFDYFSGDVSIPCVGSLAMVVFLLATDAEVVDLPASFLLPVRVLFLSLNDPALNDLCIPDIVLQLK